MLQADNYEKLTNFCLLVMPNHLWRGIKKLCETIYDVNSKPFSYHENFISGFIYLCSWAYRLGYKIIEIRWAT